MIRADQRHTAKWRVRGLAAVRLAVGCAHVNADLVRLPTVELGEAAFYPTLEAYGGAPILGDNDVKVLLNGEQIFPALVEAIRSARSSILNVVVFDRGVARRLGEVFTTDLAHATAIDYVIWRARGIRARVFELVVFPIREML